jgi:hypothetical protein
VAKRVVHECDLTKQECDPDDLVTITIKKKDKGGRGRSYDLSPEAAAKLEQQLVSNNALDEGWRFANGLAENQEPTAPEAPAEDRPQTLADFDEDATVAAKKAELREMGVIEDEREEVEGEISRAAGSNNSNGCRHLNKGPIKTRMKNGKRYIYRLCRDCGASVPEMTREEKQSYMNGELPSDIRITDRN